MLVVVQIPDGEHAVVTRVVEEMAGPAGAFGGGRDDRLHEVEPHGFGVEAVGRVEIAGRNGNVVESHAPILCIRRAGRHCRAAPDTVRSVTAATGVAFVVAGLFAVGDWYSRRPAGWITAGRAGGGTITATRLEYVCKPATLVALVAAAALLDPHVGSVRAWFVAALVLSLAGDVLLMLPKEQFVGGLAAFLVAHVCYIAGFVAGGLRAPALGIALVGTAVVLAPLARRVLRGVRANEPALTPPVVAYLVVIGTMLAAAVASGNAIAAVAAALFVTSDAMIAWSKFVAPFEVAPLAIMVTYHLAQAGFVLSLLH